MRLYMFSAKKLLITLVAIISISLSGCEKELNLGESKSTQTAVFDDLWNFMNTHYAMFTLKKVNWKQVYDEFRPQVKDEMSDQELYRLINSMLYTLKDGHVSLMTKTDTATYLNFYKPFPKNFNYSNVLNFYLNNDVQFSGPIAYKIVNRVGYMYIESFSRTISDGDLDRIFAAMKDTKGLIVDIRNNTGGQSINAEKLYSRFISERKLVKYEVTKKGPQPNDFYEPEPFYISPKPSAYKNRIAILTNRMCFSTCNDFALYMSLLPNVTLIGDVTGGGAGNPNNYILLNGWKLQYSATYTLSPSKESIEDGILPTVPIEITNADEGSGKDPILEKAFELLQ